MVGVGEDLGSQEKWKELPDAFARARQTLGPDWGGPLEMRFTEAERFAKGMGLPPDASPTVGAILRKARIADQLGLARLLSGIWKEHWTQGEGRP